MSFHLSYLVFFPTYIYIYKCITYRKDLLKIYSQYTNMLPRNHSFTLINYTTYKSYQHHLTPNTVHIWFCQWAHLSAARSSSRSSFHLARVRPTPRLQSRHRLCLYTQTQCALVATIQINRSLSDSHCITSSA